MSPWLTKKPASEIKLINEIPIVMNISADESKPQDMVIPVNSIKSESEKKYKPGERLEQYAKQQIKKEHKVKTNRNYKKNIKELLEELFIDE